MPRVLLRRVNGRRQMPTREPPPRAPLRRGRARQVKRVSAALKGAGAIGFQSRATRRALRQPLYGGPGNCNVGDCVGCGTVFAIAPASRGAIHIATTGAVDGQAEGGAFTNAQCFTSLDGRWAPVERRRVRRKIGFAASLGPSWTQQRVDAARAWIRRLSLSLAMVVILSRIGCLGAFRFPSRRGKVSVALAFACRRPPIRLALASCCWK